MIKIWFEELLYIEISQQVPIFGRRFMSSGATRLSGGGRADQKVAVVG